MPSGDPTPHASRPQRRGEVTLRRGRLPDDREQLLLVDRSFSTDRAYRVARTPSSFRLEEVPVDPPARKEFPLGGGPGEGRGWGRILVAEEGGSIVGYAAFEHERWNRRTALWHLYVAPPHRGGGVGRALVEAVAAQARGAGMRCVWLETSTLAYPAIAFYRRLGFELCGLDASLYDPAWEGEEETALYFSRAV